MARFGPGMIVAAAFVGPGTLATASVAGAHYGFALIWAIAFSLFASLVLQEMAARLGFASGAGLGEALRGGIANAALRRAILTGVIGAIALGNAAFEVGNITGAALGLEALTGLPRPFWCAVVGGLAGGLLCSHRELRIDGLVMPADAPMGVAFVATALFALAHAPPLAPQLLRPALPQGALLTTIALIGTTVVPYNLFLHASAVAQKWPRSANASLRRVRVDSTLSIALGGIITMAILVTAALFYRGEGEITGAAQIAALVEPALGAGASGPFLFGLFAAGITSAVTAPLAAGYACAGCLGWEGERRERRMRRVSWAVVGVGTLFAIVGKRPVAAIVAAQAINGVLLPILAGFLLIAVNRRALLGPYRNGWITNALGVVVIAVALGLGGAQVFSLVSRGG